MDVHPCRVAYESVAAVVKKYLGTGDVDAAVIAVYIIAKSFFDQDVGDLEVDAETDMARVNALKLLPRLARFDPIVKDEQRREHPEAAGAAERSGSSGGDERAFPTGIIRVLPATRPFRVRIVAHVPDPPLKYWTWLDYEAVVIHANLAVLRRDLNKNIEKLEAIWTAASKEPGIPYEWVPLICVAIFLEQAGVAGVEAPIREACLQALSRAIERRWTEDPDCLILEIMARYVIEHHDELEKEEDGRAWARNDRLVEFVLSRSKAIGMAPFAPEKLASRIGRILKEELLLEDKERKRFQDHEYPLTVYLINTEGLKKHSGLEKEKGNGNA